MIRIGCALIVAAVCAGCRNSPPVYDPFLGKTVVEPPGTATVAPSAPYYTSPSSVGAPLVSPPTGTTVPATPPPPTTPPPPIPHSIPQDFAPGPAGFGRLTPNVSPPGGSLVQPAASTQPAIATATPATSRPAYGPPGGMAYPQAAPIAAVQQPTMAQQTAPALLHPGSTAGAVDIRSAGGAPTPATAPSTGWQAADNNRVMNDGVTSADSSLAPVSQNLSNTIRIIEPTQPISPASNAATTRAVGEFRPANTSSLTMPVSNASSSTLNQSLPQATVNDLADLPIVQRSSFNNAPAAISAPTTGNYGYQAQYQWVKGKLEYSQSSCTWRLRYIPPDAANDNYGGSVILSDANKLAGFQPGDYVVAYGSLGQTGAEGGSFAALYDVERIEKQ